MIFHKLIRSIFILAAMLWISGCLPTTTLVYECNPPGAAYFFHGDQAPAFRCGAEEFARVDRRKWSREEKKRGYIDLPAGKFVWVGGYEIAFPARRIERGAARAIQYYRAYQPKPNQQDLMFGLEWERTEAAKRAAFAAERSAYEAERAGDYYERMYYGW